jgi:hypothetical protein
MDFNHSDSVGAVAAFMRLVSCPVHGVEETKLD